MPEFPDIELYLAALRPRIVGESLTGIRLRSPFLLRSVKPSLSEAFGREVVELRRLGKRIVIALESDLFLVLHLMIAGRLHWKATGAKIPGRRGLASFDFTNGSLILTEAGSKKRASLRLVGGESALAALDPGGLEIFDADLAAFRRVLTSSNHTMKRALTDPHLFSGIGNAYSDEILHRARLSPFKLTTKLDEEESERLFAACCEVLSEWRDRLIAETGERFPEKVTAFRPGMAVHGRYGEPCPVCGAPVQRIVYAENQANYCARCQTGGRILADRALSRLLKDDWPKTLEELEGGPRSDAR
ncbi:MAG TPA: DNA-formamidopyrimidine glycosylase family protein [Thermoanaerobaculia bacterium]|nr:DNA-formamidopyrimidine glycosylase family protein [Thermoanaerobaculia bacterium]